MAQTVKNPPAIQETQVRSLGQEDPLEKEMAIYTKLLPGESHGPHQEQGCKELDKTEQLKHSFKIESIGGITKSILKMLPWNEDFWGKSQIKPHFKKYLSKE